MIQDALCREAIRSVTPAAAAEKFLPSGLRFPSSDFNVSAFPLMPPPLPLKQIPGNLHRLALIPNLAPPSSNSSR
jgi:hypothetical protein